MLAAVGAGSRVYPDDFPNPVAPQFPTAADLAAAVASDDVEVLRHSHCVCGGDAQSPAGASRSCRGGPAAAADAAAGRGALLSLEEEQFAGDPPWTAEQFQSELAGVRRPVGTSSPRPTASSPGTPA